MLKKILPLILLASLLISTPAFAGALTSTVNKTAEEAGISQNSNLPAIIAMIVNSILGLLGLVFVVLIVYSGFTWMTAMGDAKKVEKARKTITSAVIGLLIIILSYSIVSFVSNILAKS
jgi:hypothetical protein